ncbi:MAG TPA: hypothetical protein VG757_00370 [Devosia sp.]|nr:hypothetical protein [Devosia sp.]
MSQFSKAALIAAAIFLAVPAGSMAQDIQLSLEPPNEDNVFDAGFTTTVSVPSIVAVNSSMDEAALRDVLSGGFMKHVDEVARLSADSITIPEITVSTTTTGSEPMANSFSYRDVVLTNVRDGVAHSVSVGSTESGSAEAKFAFGKISAEQMDFAGLLAIFGLVDGGDPNQPLKTIYTNYTSEGGTFSAEKVSCTLGPSAPAEFRGRPLAVSFTQFMDATKQLEGSKDNPPAEAMATVIKFVSDVFVAFEASPTSIEGIACKGIGDDGKPFDLSVGKISSGGFADAVFSGFSVDDVSIKGENDGVVTLAHAEVKPFDLRTTVAGLSAPDIEMTPAYFEKNGRKLVPAWGGFAFSGLAVDVPSDNPMAKRVKASIANFDLTLSDYINGIPSKLSTSASGISVPLPQDTQDPQVALLLALGLTDINLGFDISAGWDQASKTIVVDKVALEGANLAGIALAANLGNAAEQLFDLNPEIAQTAALGITVQGLTIDLRDDGLGNVLAPLAASPQDKTVGDVRTRLAGLAEGLVLQIFGATDQARALGAAVGNFAAGNAASLSLTITPNDPAGLSVPVLMQAGENPALLAPMITVTGVAQ